MPRRNTTANQEVTNSTRTRCPKRWQKMTVYVEHENEEVTKHTVIADNYMTATAKAESLYNGKVIACKSVEIVELSLAELTEKLDNSTLSAAEQEIIMIALEKLGVIRKDGDK